MTQFVTAQRARLKSKSLDAAAISAAKSGDIVEAAAWTAAARAMFSLDEFVTKG